jgi:CarD family transcriptional regulator
MYGPRESRASALSTCPNPIPQRGSRIVSFKVGQKVVYPNHGVSVVEKIENGEIAGIEQTYFHLRLLSNDSKVMIPKDNLDLVGLRPLVPHSEINSLFKVLRDENFDTYKDWKGRYKQNLDKMKTGDLGEVARVLKNLQLVSSKKSLSFREKKMYERAKYFIVSEVAHVKKIDEDSAANQVEKALASGMAKRRKARELAVAN